MNDADIKTAAAPKSIRIRRIEKADEPVFECSCCGRMHRIIHHMSNGAIMGKQCAEIIESFGWRVWSSTAAEVARSLAMTPKQVAYVRGLGFAL